MALGHVANGHFIARTIVKVNKRVVAEKVQDVRGVSRSFDDLPAEFAAKIGTSMSIQYQTVSTEVYVRRPCENTDAGIETCKNKVFAYIEQVLAERAGWAKEVLSTLVAAKQKAEG